MHLFDILEDPNRKIRQRSEVPSFRDYFNCVAQPRFQKFSNGYNPSLKPHSKLNITRSYVISSLKLLTKTEKIICPLKENIAVETRTKMRRGSTNEISRMPYSLKKVALSWLT